MSRITKAEAVLLIVLFPMTLLAAINFVYIHVFNLLALLLGIAVEDEEILEEVAEDEPNAV